MSFLKSLFYKLNGNHITDDQNEILEFIANELFSFDDDDFIDLVEPDERETNDGTLAFSFLTLSSNDWDVWDTSWAKLFDFIFKF